VPKLADSLAGRMGILRLHPLAQCELLGKRPRFIEVLFRGGFRTRITDRLRPHAVVLRDEASPDPSRVPPFASFL
jgi:hypothetical protein